MKKIYLLLITLIVTALGFGQISESFESGMPTSYNPTLTTVALGSGNWQVKNAIFTTTAPYYQSGTRAAQLKSAAGSQLMTPALTGGVGAISFYVTSSTTNGGYQVNISTDNGENFSPASGSPFSISTVKTLRTITINDASVNKIQIVRNGGTIYIDDFATTAFAPACPTFTLPFIENFDTAVPPTCWTQYPGTNGLGTVQQWQLTTTAGGTHSSSPGAAYLQWENVSGGLAEDWLVTPAIDLSGASDIQLSFWTKDAFNSDEGSTYSVKVSTSSQTNIADFDNLITYDETQLGNSYNKKILDLSAYSGQTVYVAFVMNNDDGDAWYLDDVSIANAPTGCSPPAQATLFEATAFDVATGTAKIKWMPSNGDTYLIVLKNGSAVDADPTSGTAYDADANFGAGDELGTGNFVVYNNSGNFVNVTGLTTDNTYYVAIYAYNSTTNCYNTEELTGSFIFTGCGIYSLPFAEGFENGVPPECWTQYIGDNSVAGNESWQSTSSYANSGTKAAYISYDDAGDTEDWLVTPPIAIPGGANASLSFYTRDESTDDYGSIYSIRVSETSPTDQSSFVEIASYDETQISDANGDFLLQTIDLSAYNNKTIYIAFILTQNFGDSWILDDVKVEAMITPIDSDTEVYAATLQIADKTIIAANTTEIDSAEDAFAFTIEDQGTIDALPTHVTTMRFVPASGNTADWSDTIQGITLTSGAMTFTPNTTTIEDTQILLTFDSPIEISNNSVMDFTLGVYLNLSPIVSGSILKFQIDASASGFTADASGSGFSDPFFLGAVIGNNITIDASTLEISNYELDAVHIYSTVNPRTLFVKGQLNSKTTVSLYDIQGRIVLTSVFERGTNNHQVDVSKISDGMYVVKLNNDSQQKTQKVLIK